MKLSTLTLRNFMPYRQTVSIEFPTEDYRNVMIVFGDNMRGKTSLLNAIRWCFYGKALGRHARVIPLQDIVNTDAASADDWTVEVFLTFEAEGHRYELRRAASRRAHITTPSKPEDFIVTTHLAKDGDVVAGDQIEAVIDQIAPEPVSRFFLFDGELLGEYEELLIQGSEQGRQIKEAIEQVLGVPALTKGKDVLGSLLRSATKKQGAEMARVDGLKAQAEHMNALSARLDAQLADLEGLKNQLSEFRSERVSLDDELERAASVFASKGRLDAARESAESHEANRKQKRLDRQKVLSAAWKDMLDARLQHKREVLRAQQAMATARLKERLDLDQKITSIEKTLKNNSCPSCGEPYPAEKRQNLELEFRTLKERYQADGEAGYDLQSVLKDLALLESIRGSNAKGFLLELDKDIRRSDIEWQKAQNDIERFSEEIEGRDTAELTAKRSRHSHLLKEEGRLGNAIESTESEILKTRNELNVARKAVESLGGSGQPSSSIKATILNDLENCFSKSIDHLRDRLRSQVQDLANSSFKAMTTQKSYQGLEINENYGLSILDSNGRTVTVRSAGAEQVVALSLIDGLNRTGRAVGPVVMDTPFGRLDPTHRDNILRYLPTVTSQLILLVHGGEIRPESDLASIKARIGGTYRIREVSERQSTIEKAAL